MTAVRDPAGSIAEINRDRHTHLANVVGWFVSFGLIALTVAWLGYFLVFRGHDIVADPAAWGQLGDFMGGVLNPILSFLTLFILAFTIILQSRQLATTTEGLELSRQELKSTREELARSAQAQERAEEALREQAAHAGRSARLATLSQLWQHYQEERAVLYEDMDAAKAARSIEVERRIRAIKAEFDKWFDEILPKTAA